MPSGTPAFLLRQTGETCQHAGGPLGPRSFVRRRASAELRGPFVPVGVSDEFGWGVRVPADLELGASALVRSASGFELSPDLACTSQPPASTQPWTYRRTMAPGLNSAPDLPADNGPRPQLRPRAQPGPTSFRTLPPAAPRFLAHFMALSSCQGIFPALTGRKSHRDNWRIGVSPDHPKQNQGPPDVRTPRFTR